MAGNHERVKTTDQLRTTPAELSAHQRSTLDTAISGSRSTTVEARSGGQGVRLRHGTHMADQAGGATKIIGIKITEQVLLGVVG
jgi:hypothetical protein